MKIYFFILQIEVNMQFLENLRIALRGLAVNKLRSILTMLGIIIGVGAVIALISVGQGFESYITEQFASLGTNLLFVVPGQLESGGPHASRRSRGAEPLTMNDAAALKRESPRIRRFAQSTSCK